MAKASLHTLYLSGIINENQYLEEVDKEHESEMKDQLEWLKQNLTPGLLIDGVVGGMDKYYADRVLNSNPEIEKIYIIPGYTAADAIYAKTNPHSFKINGRGSLGNKIFSHIAEISYDFSDPNYPGLKRAHIEFGVRIIHGKIQSSVFAD